MRNTRRKALSLFMATVLSLAFFAANNTLTAYATQRTTRTTTRTTTRSKSQINKQIQEQEKKKQQLNNDLSVTQNEVLQLMTKINSLSRSINEKQVEIQDLEYNIRGAQADLDKQYNQIKLRLKYTYENQGDRNIFTILLESKGIGDFLNRVEYVNQIYKSDKEQMDRFQAMKQEFEELKRVASKEKANLEAQRTELSVTKKTLDSKVAVLKQQIGNVDAELNKLRQEAAKKAEEERKAREAAQRQVVPSSGSGGSGSSSSGSSRGELAGQGLNPSSNIDGNAVVSYARQFVGNPYVWGGNSLTNGCDCSGFVKLIYAHFGVSTCRYSQAFLGEGKPVSIECIRPGDVVVYPGHVAIYAGGGVIVEAQSESKGITYGRPLRCHSINGIRRF